MQGSYQQTLMVPVYLGLLWCDGYMVGCYASGIHLWLNEWKNE